MFTSDAVLAMKTHALAEYPRESCGIVVDGVYFPLPNRAADPERNFRIDDADYIEHADRIEAIVHSHPDGPLHPSAADMRGQIASAVPWAILAADGERCSEPLIWGDGAPVPELIGREFVHGVTDCYALVRDYYRTIIGIVLPEFPRDDEWWVKGQNLYLDHFGEAGFSVVPLDDARVGDVVLMTVLSPVPNHAGVIFEPGTLLHHLPRRLSRREPLGLWHRQIVHILRHKDRADG